MNQQKRKNKRGRDKLAKSYDEKDYDNMVYDELKAMIFERDPVNGFIANGNYNDNTQEVSVQGIIHNYFNKEAVVIIEGEFRIQGKYEGEVLAIATSYNIPVQDFIDFELTCPYNEDYYGSFNSFSFIGTATFIINNNPVITAEGQYQC